MLNDKLLLKQYYVNKFSLFLQQDEILMCRIKDAVSFLNNINDTTSAISIALSTMMSGLFNDMQFVEDYQYDDLLDKIAACFNVYRKFTVIFDDDEAAFESQYEGVNLPQDLELTNDQLRLLLLCKIATNSFDGSANTVNKLYNLFIDKLKPKNINDSWQIFAYTINNQPGNCGLVFSIENYTFNDPIINQYFSLFFADMLTIKSMGIQYHKTVINTENILIFDTPTSTEHTWDNGRWL